MAEVLIPPASGAASALGFLAAPLSFEQVRSHPVRLDRPGAAPAIDAVLTELEADTRAEITNAGIAPADVVVERSADMRLFGQLHEISVALPDGAITEAAMPGILAAFRRAYEARYTAVYEGVAIQIVSVRIRARVGAAVGPHQRACVITAPETAGPGSPGSPASRCPA